MKNKKGLATAFIVIIIIGMLLLTTVLILPVILKSTGIGESNKAKNYGNEPTGCEAKTYNYEITGTMEILNSKISTLEPEIKAIEGIQFKKLAFGFDLIEPFNYKVELFRKDNTDKHISIDEGQADIRLWYQGAEVNFNLPFEIDDCDGLIDTELILIATISETSDLIKDTSTMTKYISIRKGELK